jgi:hypothetical protein
LFASLNEREEGTDLRLRFVVKDPCTQYTAT